MMTDIALTIYMVAAVFVVRAAYCRLARTSKRTDPRVRANFVLAAAGQITAVLALLVAAVEGLTEVEALSIGLTAISVCTAVGYWLSSHRWRWGPPLNVQRDEVPAIFPWERREQPREGTEQ